MAHDVDPDRWAKGAAKMADVYQDVVPVVPHGFMDFADIMTEDLFGSVWARDALDVRDRRLVIMGAIAAVGGPTTWKIQCLAGLKRGDFDEHEVREVLIQATPYVGYPRAAEMVGVTEEAIAEYKKELADAAEKEGEK